MSDIKLTTKEDFEKEVNAFWGWAARCPQLKSSWFFALERYASRMGRLASELEKAKEKEQD